MGVIRKVLAKSEGGNTFYYKDSLRIEQAEFVHLHWRDVRLVLNEQQFAFLIQFINKADKVWNGYIGTEDTVLSTAEIPDGVIFDNIISIEEQENGDVHFHYQDMRIELSRIMFVHLADLFIEARSRLMRGDE